MEDDAWIDFEGGEEPRPLPDGRYEADIQARGALQNGKHLRREGGGWYWDWDQEDRYPVNNSPGYEQILRVRRVGDLKLPSRRVGG